MSRLYAVECTPSNTGAMADHRLPLRASEIETFTRTLALAVRGVTEAGALLPYAAWLGALARDLLRHRGRSVAIPGDRSEEHTSELQSQSNLVCRLLLEKKKKNRM